MQDRGGATLGDWILGKRTRMHLCSLARSVHRWRQREGGDVWESARKTEGAMKSVRKEIDPVTPLLKLFALRLKPKHFSGLESPSQSSP